MRRTRVARDRAAGFKIINTIKAERVPKTVYVEALHTNFKSDSTVSFLAARDGDPFIQIPPLLQANPRHDRVR